MTAELHHLDNRHDDIVRDAVFHRMTLDTSDACSNMLTLTFGQEGEQRINHVVIEPIHVRIKQNGGGRKLLQIEAESGVTLVTFSSGRFPVEGFESEFADLGKPTQKPELSIPS